MIFPVLKIEDEKLITGHLGYFNSNGILIPLAVKKGNKVEYAFSEEIAHGQNGNINQLVKLNTFKNYRNYKRLSLLEFLQLAESNSQQLNILKNKIVLIGVTAPSITNKIILPDGNEISGLTLQAISVDNIINNQILNNNSLSLSGYLFLLIAAALIFLRKNVKPVSLYSMSAVLFAIFTAIIFNNYFITQTC